MGDDSIRFAPDASLEYYHASLAEVQVELQVDGAEACHHEDAPRECDHIGEGGGGDSRCEVLQD